jgi:hypothetical protein
MEKFVVTPLYQSTTKARTIFTAREKIHYPHVARVPQNGGQ